MQKTEFKKKQSGFTLIEILVVIGMIALLAAIVIVAINPARQFAQGRNTQRTSNINAILNGIGQYIADHKGEVPPGIPAKGAGADAISDNLCDALIPTYLSALPTDPQSADYKGAAIEEADCGDLGGTAPKETDYTVKQDNNGRITVCADNAHGETALDTNDDGTDNEEPICVTR